MLTKENQVSLLRIVMEDQQTWGFGRKHDPKIQTVSSRKFDGQRTEQVKTGQVNPDRPLVGPSVDTFVGCFRGESLKG